jgi:deoxycytidylate deaminase
MPTSRKKSAPARSDVPAPRGRPTAPATESQNPARHPSDGPIELVFGLVGPTGVDLTRICSVLEEQLKAVGYEPRVVRVSELILPYIGKEPRARDDYSRIDELMTEGTRLRRSTKLADIVGRLGLAQIRELRREISGDPKTPPDRGVAYIVRSFKRPEEVSIFRDAYGKAFNLISVYSPRAARIEHLSRRFHGLKFGVQGPEELAVRLVNRDYEEEGKLGQQLGRTFPLADFFVSNAPNNVLERQLRRFVRLVFGDPYISPTKDEQGMFLAQASALRSLDLSRQVGAAIVNDDGDVLATGCNEVPKFGGGLYWAEDEGVMRDVELGRDSNASIKGEIVEDAVRRLREKEWLSASLTKKSDAELARLSLYGPDPFFRDSRLFDVIEFGRAVHAEMAAITQASRLGIPLKGSKLFSTTFPCHICARHIVATGIHEVQFIEPYEKSRTQELFSDSICVEPQENVSGRVQLKSFVGVAPRRYMDLFSLSVERKKKDGFTLGPETIAVVPKVRRFVLAYLLAEEKLIDGIPPPPGLA